MNYEDTLQEQLIQQAMDEQRFSMMGFSEKFAGEVMAMGVYQILL